MKRQINISKNVGEVRVGGHNVKLGLGGIREIEFFAQTQQLVAGGRDADAARSPHRRGAAGARPRRLDRCERAVSTSPTPTGSCVRSRTACRCCATSRPMSMPESEDGVDVIAPLMSTRPRAFEAEYRARARTALSGLLRRSLRRGRDARRRRRRTWCSPAATTIRARSRH